MKLDCLNIVRVLLIGVVVAAPCAFADSANAQNQNMTPNMVINMSDLSIKIGNSTSNETITFSNNTGEETASSTQIPGMNQNTTK